MDIENDWVVTDNTTLTDATKFVLHDLDPSDGIGRIYYLNWLNFIEGVILHGKMLADNHIFQHQKDIQYLKSHFPDCIDGIDLGKERDNITKDVRRVLKGRKDSDSPQEWSHLHRGLFYINVAKQHGLPYRPAYSREKAFSKYLDSEWNHIDSTSKNHDLTNNILDNIANAQDNYKSELENLGAPKFIGAKIPPLATLVLNEAIKTQSWSEAINTIRVSKGAEAFRAWLREVVDCLSDGDVKARRELEKAGNFLKNWTIDPDEGVKYKMRGIKVAQVNKYLEPGINIAFRDPVIFQQQHIVFMSELFKSNIGTTNTKDFRGIKL